MSKQLSEYPALNEAWKVVRSEKIKDPSGMTIERVVRVPTFGIYKRDLEKTSASVFLDEIVKLALKIKEVDGGKVKVEHNMDFVEGGHDKVYPKFIPKGEVWVDKNLAPKERPFVKFHEMVERARMQKGESYEKAHEVANKAEKAARLMSPETK